MRHISDDERRARIGVRHALAPGSRVGDPVAATEAMTALHATEAATVHLSLHARVDGLEVADVERALYDDRSLVKQLAMRRTLFVLPRDLLPAVWGSASARVAGTELRRTAKVAVDAGLAVDGEAWVEQACAAVLALLVDGSGLTAQEVRERLPALDVRVLVAAGTRWETEVSLVPRLLTLLGARGQVVRGRSPGHWRTSRPQWHARASWLPDVPTELPASEGYAELVRSWLRSFGPGTEDDLVWWLGSTRTAARRALADVGAVPVGLDSGSAGFVLPDDLEPVAPVRPWAALLPVLDPTTMGWRERDFYLRPGDAAALFDSNGNAGTTAWWDGRVVGCWVQDEQGVVRVLPSGPVDAAARRALDEEARRLTGWLDGVRVTGVYSSPLMRSARSGTESVPAP